MAVRTDETGFGGTAWGDEALKPTIDLNPTISAVINRLPPIGAIVAWAKSITGVPTLPDGWAECDGSTVSDSDSPINGETIPDLNASSGTARFLRGATTSGGTGGSETHRHSIAGGSDANGGLDPGRVLFTGLESTLPSYYSVVWIMRYK